MPTPGYAVLDVHTTGLWPERHHRIVEIAIVHLDGAGAVERSWTSAVDAGPEAERLTGAQPDDRAERAPQFAELADTITGLCADRALVAHNAAFEMRFLSAEFDRVGLSAPLGTHDALCTMRLAHQLLPGAGRALADCCAAYDIELGPDRSTLADALGTARLMEAFLTQGSPIVVDAAPDAGAAARPAWSHPLPSASASSTPDRAPRSFLERTMSLLPDFEWEEQVDLRQRDYLGMLDQALADGFLFVHEALELRQYAAAQQIDPFCRDILNRRYFDNLVTAAWARAPLSDAERADLVSVARLLELPTQLVVWAIKPRALHWPPPGMEIDDLVGVPGPVRLERGDAVALTGELSRPSAFFEQVLTDLGMVASAAVTREVALVVAADVDSDSGRCRKARDYGIPIVTEEVLMGVLVG